MPSATHIEAMRPPRDFPPASTAPPALRTAASNAASHVSRRTRAGSGERLPRSTYGKLKRTVETPASAMARLNPAMNGWSIPAPAPCARTRVATDPFDAIHAVLTLVPPTSSVPRTSGDAMPRILADGRNPLSGHVGLRLRRVEARRLLPRGVEEPGDALVLREPVPLGRDQLHVPALPDREVHGDVEGRDAGGV